MSRVLMMLLLAVVSSSATADWLKIYSEDVFSVYAESPSIRKNGSNIKLWQIIDYTKPQNLSNNPLASPIFFSSTKGQFELDCKNEQVRQIYFLYQAGNMGMGRNVSANETPMQWMPVVPDTALQILWKYACIKEFKAAISAKSKQEKASINSQYASDYDAIPASSAVPASKNNLADEWDAIEVKPKQ